MYIRHGLLTTSSSAQQNGRGWWPTATLSVKGWVMDDYILSFVKNKCQLFMQQRTGGWGVGGHVYVTLKTLRSCASEQLAATWRRKHIGSLCVDYSVRFRATRCVSNQLGALGRKRIHFHGNWWLRAGVEQAWFRWTGVFRQRRLPLRLRATSCPCQQLLPAWRRKGDLWPASWKDPIPCHPLPFRHSARKLSPSICWYFS